MNTAEKIIEKLKEAKKEEEKDSVGYYKDFLEKETGENMSSEDCISYIENAEAYGEWENILYTQGYLSGLYNAIRIAEQESK